MSKSRLERAAGIGMGGQLLPEDGVSLYLSNGGARLPDCVQPPRYAAVCTAIAAPLGLSITCVAGANKCFGDVDRMK